MMKLYIGNKKYSSWSLRPWMAMKETGLPFEEEVIPLDMPDTTARIRAVSPVSRVPVLVDGGLVLWESLAICEYLAERYPEKKLWPWNFQLRTQARVVSHEMHAGFAALRQNCPMKVLESFPHFVANEAALAEIRRIDELWRDALESSGGPFLFGEFSIADAMFAPVVFRVRTYHLPISSASQNYVATMLATQSLKEWLRDAEKETHRAKRYEATM